MPKTLKQNQDRCTQGRISRVLVSLRKQHPAHGHSGYGYHGFASRNPILTACCLAVILSAAAFPKISSAQTPAARKADETAIRSVIESQVVAWNRGDIPAFMASYEDSPETTFVGTASVNKGFQPILERYKKGYANKDQMGTLTFKELDIRLLPSASHTTEYALVTGRFHLERTAKGTATKDDGIFSLVWHKTATGWKIVLDHTA
jgi:ketosteroid isomerase-like protein